jgi:hypothetical protein
MVARRIIALGLAMFALASTSSLIGRAVSPASAATSSASATKPPPIPHCYYTGSGYGLCEGIVLPMPGTVITLTHPDKTGVFKLTGPAPLQTKKAVACGDLGCVYNHLDWAVFATRVSGCKSNTTTCNVRVRQSSRWTPVYVRQNTALPILYLLWNSGKPGGTISGYVRDKDEHGLQGATVHASGPTSASSTADPTTGYYALSVTEGRYKVTPSGGPTTIKSPKFDPMSREVAVKPGATSRADFTLNGGLRVLLALSKTAVAADGYTVVQGVLSTTQYGRPYGNVTVSLRPKPSESGTEAVTTGVRATICGASGTRIWPTGVVTSPLGPPVDVVTDATGKYDFTMTIGTVPGSFVLNAWAKDASGQLITTDLRDTSPDVTLRVDAPGNWNVTQFTSEVATLSTDSAANKIMATMSNDAPTMTQALSQLSASSKLGGLAYSLVSGTSSGAAVLIYNDTTPPTIGTTGQITSATGALVLSPAMWVGTKAIALTTLNTVMQKGLLSAVPTFDQWSHAGAVAGWKLTTNAANVASSNFQYNGWAYPSTAMGACA